jgi:ABC-type uncharacterized transport system substrate-binding protein
MSLAVFLICGLHPVSAQDSKKFKVLVVMSYHETMPWVKEIKNGIYAVLGEKCDVDYFYMDTKNHFENGDQKAKEAYARYLEINPDGVIAVDDDAQMMFVVPYLKEKVKTPVIFCGVNAAPETYGFPCSNVTGVLERLHFKESIAFAQQLIPSISNFAYMIKESPVGSLNMKQIESERGEFSATFVAAKFPKTLKETLTMTKELRDKCDLLVLSTMSGILDDDGHPLSDKQVVPMVVKAFAKPVVGTEEQVVVSGALCSILRTGQEQGEKASEILLKAMEGTPVAQIPITRNYQGKRIINVTSLKEMGIKPKMILLQGVTLVKTEN